MPAVFERIRMEVGGNPPKVLHSSEWVFPDTEFLLPIAREALASYYKPGVSLSVHDDLDSRHMYRRKTLKLSDLEAIRLVRDGREIARYDLDDLLQERNANRSPRSPSPRRTST
jgi:hypothetical protein